MSAVSYRRRLAVVVGVLLLVGWGLAYATVETARAEFPDLIAWPWAQIAVGAAVAGWGGLTATLNRYLAATYNKAPFFWWRELIRDGFVSVTAGAVAYFGGAWAGMHTMLLGAVLLLAGYAGASWLSKAADRLLGVLVAIPSGEKQ